MSTKRIKHKLIGFVALTWDILNSKAYKSLTPSAAKILPYFLGKPKIHPKEPTFYSKEFDLTYSEANNYGFSSSTYARCIEELTQKGFIDPVRKGGLRGEGKSSNKYKMSNRWIDYGRALFRVKSWKQFN